MAAYIQLQGYKVYRILECARFQWSDDATEEGGGGTKKGKEKEELFKGTVS